MVSTPAGASLAARAIIAELRHQYLLAFAAARRPGWYPVEVKTRRTNLTVRARSGYVARGGSALLEPSTAAPPARHPAPGSRQ